MCRSCHTEHLGREADIVTLDVETFDHRASDFPLRGAHRRADCLACHEAGTKYRDASDTCIACHAEDDAHQGQLGEDCASCHSDDGDDSRQAHFDHDATRFPLGGKHVDVDCVLCHPSDDYKAAPTDCRGCHSVNDVHRGRFGESCGDCHGTRSWKRGSFDHTARTRFPLRGKHREAACSGCHVASAPAQETKLDMRCVGCHRADDEHRGSFGASCEDCHGPEAWQRTDFDHARDTKFPLLGAHRDASCESCHRGGLRAETRIRSCYDCHAEDDVHRGHEGNRCESCHEASSWTEKVTFDHELTRFPLLGLHAVVPCEECHASMAFQNASKDCDACHADQDTHGGSLGNDCAECHNPNGWERWHFDHATQTRFALHGAHANLDCRGCHSSPASGGGVDRATDCGSCHQMDDAHRGSFGSRCEDCHLDSSWHELRIRH